MTNYKPSPKRYDEMKYRRCGQSGIKLPLVSLGLWHNFGSNDSYDNARGMVQTAFDLGITHFDLANNYGPIPGSAEENFGKILRQDFNSHRDEMIISTKAGYHMWNGPYGDGGSKKYLVASLEQSLKRLNLDYVDIFYHHRPDDDTPVEESMQALDLLVRQGKVLYVGLSNYKPTEAKLAIDVLHELGTPCLIHQPNYSMLDRWIEDELIAMMDKEGVGIITFSPLQKGLLTDRYLKGIPEDSRMASDSIFLNRDELTKSLQIKLNALDEIANGRGQTLAQMALAWNLRNPRITSVLVGASRKSQIEDSARAIENLEFTVQELEIIDDILL
ncbi:aldo/keto reductase [Fusibacter ferrireducens]|uniref:Aldo/keto reductase n=1 Tax=Fusibacter ferrireducens TaxID=2785058 RepID=A0ABR9ZQF4_9FIRM|nr:aldo/keto reductase [Fusibacter ferrireducens]MBF4691864.1 aldo/keto reductase [Fusibacter ferrireducens]